jgi:hypothetical protein
MTVPFTTAALPSGALPGVSAEKAVSAETASKQTPISRPAVDLDVIFIDTLSVLSLMFEDFKILPILDMLSDGTGRPPQNGEPIHPATQGVSHNLNIYHDAPRGAMGLAALTGLGGAPRCFSG